MPTSKTKRETDPSAALYALIEQEGSTDDVWDDLLGSVSDDPKERLARALVGHDKYDDRAAGIVFAALLERSLQLAITSILATETKRSAALFSYRQNGPLSSFAAKVKIGEGIGLYDSAMRDDLDLIVLMRNVFAHAPIPVNFKHDAIIFACNSLVVSKNLSRNKSLSVGHRSKAWNPNLWTPRQKFTGAIAVMTNFLGMYPQLPFSGAAMSQHYVLMYRRPLALPGRFGT